MMAAECLAGRLVTPARLCKQVKTALESQGWRKESVKIAPVRLPDVDDPPQGKTLAIALAPVGVRAVQRLLAAEAAAAAATARDEELRVHRAEQHGRQPVT